jgi:hypothetical protein
MEATETAKTEQGAQAPRVRPEDPRERVLRDYDFVNSKRMNNSLAVVEEKYAEGAPDHVIAALLCISVEEVEKENKAITEKLRQLMKV